MIELADANEFFGAQTHLLLDSQRGMTLLEVLVVVVIAAILASMVVVTWSSDPVKDQLKSASDDLGFKLSYGFEEAVMRSADLGLFVYEDGYSWAQWVVDTPSKAGQEESEPPSDERQGRWSRLSTMKPWRAETLKEGYRLAAKSGQPTEAVVLKPRPRKTDPKKPALDAMVLPLMAHGETYPSIFTITHLDSGRSVAVSISEFGDVEILKEDEDL